MSIGLIDLDSKLPNLALMKIKRLFPEAELSGPMFASSYDMVFVSSVFNFSLKPIVPASTMIFEGGTGYNVKSRLLPHIEKLQPDYSLYPGCRFSWQRFTYGCVRKCPFCVSWKMGKFEELEPMNLNPDGEYIYLLDNNFFASAKWKENINYLIGTGQPVKFEGIDARIVSKNDEMLYLLNKLKLKGRMHTAWDLPEVDMMPLFRNMTKVIKPYKIMCYVLIGFGSTHEKNMHRVKSLSSIGIDPFVMPYDKSNDYQAKFARWVNCKEIYRSCTWEEYRYR